MLGQRAAALEDDVSRIEGFVEQGGDGALESRGCTEVPGAVPDEPTVVAVDGKAGAYADIDSEEGGQPQLTTPDSIKRAGRFVFTAEVTENGHQERSWST